MSFFISKHMSQTENNIDLQTLLERVINNLKRSFNCVKIGRVVAFYPEDKTADIQILFKTKKDDEIVEYPLLLKCLVVGNKITVPVEVGDDCVVLFNDCNLDSYFDTGELSTPYTNDLHDISDGIVIMGLNSLQNKITYDNSAICLNYTNIKINGFLAVSSDVSVNGNVNISNDITANKIAAICESTNGWTGVFATGDSRTVTVEKGIITKVE